MKIISIIIGFVFLEARKLFDYGFKQYFLYWSNIFNLTKTILYVCYFGLKYYSIAMVASYIKKLSDESFWKEIPQISSYDYNQQKKILQVFYMLNAGK